MATINRQMTAQELAPLAAQMFHEAYERLAPEHGYNTRDASAVPWDQVPEPNKSLMIATAAAVLDGLTANALVTIDARIMAELKITAEEG